MEEKAHGDYLFDKSYINKSLRNLQSQLSILLKGYELLCRTDSILLNNTAENIQIEIEKILGKIKILPDHFTIIFDKLNKNDSNRVGSKNAQLGNSEPLRA